VLLYDMVQFHGEIKLLAPLFYGATLLPIVRMLTSGVLMWHRANAVPASRFR
jgi:hypothetical protein